MNIVFESINGNLLEKVNRYLLLMLIILFVISCTTSKKQLATEEESTNSSISNLEERSGILFDQDSLYEFHCDDKKYSLYGHQISRPYFPADLRDCLLENGFNGHRQSNEQLANIIRMVGKDRMNTLSRFSKFRGKQVFEAFLSISNDYSPVFDHDDGLIIGTKANALAGNYIKMIKSIDGKDFLAFGMELWQNNKTRIPEEYDPITSKYNFQHDVEWSKLQYEATVKAWKEDKIVLKNFGEE